MRSSVLFASVAACAVGGCTTHPSPIDFAGVSTHNIVRHVRCEARDAVARVLGDWLVHRHSNDPRSAEGVEMLHGFGERLMANPLELPAVRAELKRERRLAPFSEVFETTMKTGLAYNFEFDITEKNGLSAEIGLTRALTNSVGALGVTTALDRTRQNVRTFDTSDTFEKLWELQPRYCEGLDLASDDKIYPMAGNVGIDRTVAAFFSLALTDNPTAKRPSTSSTMTEQLKFTTTVSGNLHPSITYTPASAPVTLTTGKFLSDNSRTDIHKLTINLTAAGDPRALQQIVFQSWNRSAAAATLLPGGGIDAETAARAGLATYLGREIKFQLVQ